MQMSLVRVNDEHKSISKALSTRKGADTMKEKRRITKVVSCILQRANQQTENIL